MKNKLKLYFSKIVYSVTLFYKKYKVLYINCIYIIQNIFCVYEKIMYTSVYRLYYKNIKFYVCILIHI